MASQKTTEQKSKDTLEVSDYQDIPTINVKRLVVALISCGLTLLAAVIYTSNVS